MANILVFSKDRPMQLHAYIESLLLFSNIDEDKISVLYCHKDNISYNKVKCEFPRVKWIKEVDFYRQVLDWIDACDDDYIMFGCDDVVFKGSFALKEGEEFLYNHEDVFGFSLRLGHNLKDFPKNVKKIDKFYCWKWNVEKTGNFYYPWELDCTLYRKEDVQYIVSEQRIGITNPNYLEEFVALKPTQYIERNELACFAGKSKAIVITVNRVQDTHKNSVDDSLQTDSETLAYLYNNLNYRLDINKIAHKKNKIVHVGAEFFILNKRIDSKSRTSGIKRRVKNLIKNLIFLSSMDITTDALDEFVLKYDAELIANIKKAKIPSIMNSVESLELLEKEPKSFCRLGDGELDIILGKSIPFQCYESKLKQYLQDILSYKYEDIYVGIPYFYFDSTENLTPMVRDFVRLNTKKYRECMAKNCSMDKQYIDTAVTQMYQTYDKYDFVEHFERVKELFRNKKITLLIGKGIYQQYKYNLFEYADDFELIEGPRKDAFTEVECLVERLSECDNNRLICVVLGPTAKAITVEMTKRGYIVWDIGHVIKDYNYFMDGYPRTQEVISEFYSPE